jgi:hypothetical protein
VRPFLNVQNAVVVDSLGSLLSRTVKTELFNRGIWTVSDCKLRSVRLIVQRYLYNDKGFHIRS